VIPVAEPRNRRRSGRAVAALIINTFIDHGGQAVGDLNPLLYGRRSGTRPAFHDPSIGGNAAYNSGKGLRSGPGWAIPIHSTSSATSWTSRRRPIAMTDPTSSEPVSASADAMPTVTCRVCETGGPARPICDSAALTTQGARPTDPIGLRVRAYSAADGENVRGCQW